jgi:ubiquinone/menaquinone biosynthesis C-methylase UbiE
MTDYANFARFYDQIMGDRTETVARIENYLDRYRPGARTLLELGCGTGAILAGLANRLDVTGLDRSPEMLAIAAAKLPGANLVQADMTAFRLDDQFDAVICVFDTLNHLPRFEQWLAMFARVREHLADGGLFAFDVNTTGRFARLHRTPRYVGYFGGGVFSMGVRAFDGDLSMWTTTIIERNDGNASRQYQERILELVVPLTRLREALAADFELLEETGLDGELPTDEAERVFFACRRRAG